MSTIWKTEAGAKALAERYRGLLKFWPVPSEQLFIPTSQGETFVIASGARDAPPLVLLHGAGGNSLAWLRDVAAWSEYFRVLAVDVIGEPGLSAPSRPPLSSEHYAQWLADLLDRLLIPAANFVGVSLGGWLALDFATRRPERVTKLALLCPGGVGRQKTGFIFKAMFLLLFGQWGRRKALALALGSAADTASPGLSSYMSDIFKEFRPRRDRLPIFSDEKLKRLTMPVLAVVGDEDAMLDSRETLARLTRNVAKLQPENLRDTGHLITGQTGRILAFLLGET